MQKIKVNDEVVVTKGKSRGQKGKIQKINFKQQKVYVSGVRIVKKAIRPNQANPDGGIVDVEAPIHISNVSLVSPKTQKATRVRIETRDNKKVRVAVSCGSVIE